MDGETEEDFQQLIGSWQSAWLFERLMAENILETTFRLAEMLYHGFKGVLTLEDIEGAFPLLRRLGLWATNEALGAGEEYVTYRKCQYGDEGGGASPVRNVMVAKGKVRMGGGMEDGR